MENFQNIPDEIKEYIISFLTNKLSEQQAKKLLDWVKESDERKVFFDQLTDIWHSSSLLNKTENFDSIDAWEEISSHIQQKNNRNIYRWIAPLLRVAAVLIIVILSVLLLRKTSAEKIQEQYVEMVAPLGSRSFVVLSDGTKVWLNSGSKIRFSNLFGKTTREVNLEGEAYFTVAKNKDIPFIVHAADVNVTAIGTAFNVKAYADEGKVETTLEEGIVKIESKNKDKLSDPLILKPKQKAIYSKNVVLVNEPNNQTSKTEPEVANTNTTLKSATVEVDSLTDTKPFTSWKDNRWIFRHETLHDLARKLERRYDVEISFADTSIRNYTFSGSLYDESIEQVFEAIKLIAPINFRINHKKIEISTNKFLIDKYEKLKK